MLKHSPPNSAARPGRHGPYPPLVAMFLFLVVSLSVGQSAFAVTDHTAGFTRYARVERADGTYREMLIDDATLGALQAELPLAEGATILMESYYRPDEIGSIFAKRFDGERWLYGSFRQGEPLPTFSPSPQCAGCHRSAVSSEGTFTLPMLRRFAETDVVQRVQCDHSGRAPCEPSVYADQ